MTALVLLVSGLVVAALMQPIFGTRTDFSIYNTRWNGASDLARDLYGEDALLPAFSVSMEGDDVTIAHRSFVEFELDPGTTSLVLLGPATPPTSEEAAWLRDFLAGGGRIMLADDFGAGNAFLEAVGATSRFDGGLVMDLAYAKKPQFAVATHFVPHDLTHDLDEVVLDHGTALAPGAGATVLGATGESAWIDRNGNVYRDGPDSRGPLPWLALERVGAGEILLVSDPSLLINGMRALGDNGRFADKVTSWLTAGNRQVMIDESHHDYVDPVKLMGVTLRAMSPALRAALAVTAAVVFIALTLGEPSRWFRWPLARLRHLVDRLLPQPPEPPRDVVAVVLERHPDWDENALRRITTGWERP